MTLTTTTPHLTLSLKERERLAVMQQLLHGEITRTEAAESLHLGERQFYRVFRRYKEEGNEGLIHRLRGTRSNRRYTLKLRTEVIHLYHTWYEDYGPTLFGEMLAKHHHIHISRETLRQWLLAKGFWKGARKKRPHRKKRDRRTACGSLLQFDGSSHRWFELRAPECCLLVAIDDATSKVMALMTQGETTQTTLIFWRQYILRYGIPKELYTDYDSVYRNNLCPERLTDFGKAMKKMGVHHIFAGSPEAKGRVERSNRTFQDRLVKELRRQNIVTLADANKLLEEEFLPEFNDRFSLSGSYRNIHRRSVYTETELNNIFCLEQVRQVKNDYTISWKGRFLQLLPGGKASLPLPRSWVVVRTWLDGSLHISASASLGGEDELSYHRCSPTPARKKPSPYPTSLPGEDHPWRHKPEMGTKRALRNLTRKRKTKK